MKRFLKYYLAVFFVTLASAAYADISVPLYQTAEEGPGKLVGTVQITQTKYGLLFTPELHDLPPGLHGFHIHQNPSCDNNGMAAGGHLDPAKTNKHLGPYNDKGHLGDLPAMYVASNGTATQPTLAPRLQHFEQLKKHTLMIHEGGDNYSGAPAKLGGGGMRMFCGVIK